MTQLWKNRLYNGLMLFFISWVWTEILLTWFTGEGLWL